MLSARSWRVGTAPTLELLPELLGKVLVHDHPDGTTSGLIVEAEAYIGEDDPACHASRGLTPRTAPMFGPPGRAYVYLNYGLHNLINVVTEPEGFPAALLIRALAPLEGIDLMRRRRGPVPDARLCDGPGKLTQAMGITLQHNTADLSQGALRLEDHGYTPGEITYTPRIGIRVGTDKRWRAYSSSLHASRIGLR